MNRLEYHLFEEARATRMGRRELIRRASVLGLSASSVAGMLTSLGSSPLAMAQTAASAAPRRGGTARLGMRAPGVDADPVTGASVGGIRTVQAASEYLTYPRPDYTLDPRLATAWRSSNSKDWTFTIRQGVKWQDGSLLSADDVVASYDRLTDPNTKSAARASFKGVLSKGNTEKVDNQTVAFHLDRPYTNFPYLTSAFNYNAVILPKNYEVGSKSFTKGRIGTGAFILTAFSQEQAVFTRNPDYWDNRMPYLDGLVLRFFEDETPIGLALQGGAIDGMTTLAHSGAPALLADANIEVLQNNSSDYRTLQMRTDMAPFSDKRVRQALALSIDRNAIAKALFADRAVIGNDHAFAPIFPDSRDTSQITQRRQDYALARKLLADAGFPDGITATLTTEQFLEIPQFAVFVKEQAAPAGFRINLDIRPQNAYYGSGNNQPWLEVPLGITDWGPRGNPSDQIAPAYLCGAPYNSAHWCNTEFDKLMAQYDGEVDEQNRRRIAVQAARIQHEEVPVVIAYWDQTLRAVRKRLRGLAPGPNFLDARSLWLTS